MSQNEQAYNHSEDNINFAYINSIDIFIDKSIDTLNDLIKGEIKINQIDKLISGLHSKLDYTDLNVVLTDEKTIKVIKDTISKYFYLYCLLRLAFINNIDEIRDLLIKQEKIGKFVLDTNNIYLVIYYATMIIDINLIIKNMNDLTKVPDIQKKTNALNFLNNLGQDFVTEIFIKNNKSYKHNVLKTIIFREIYKTTDMPNIIKLIELEELSKAEFTYIDIVDSLIDEIDYDTIEKLFSSKDTRKDMAEYMYEMLVDYETKFDTQTVSQEQKINELFNNNILIPITDEFLRYHKDSERYEKNVGTQKIDPRERTSKKDNTKIRYIVTKINKLIDYHNIKKKGDKNSIEELNKLLYPSLIYRKVVIINELEELSIINKIINQGKHAMENNEFYSDLISFRSYPYINFKDVNKYGFQFKFDNTKLALRYCNFEYKDAEKFPMQYKNYIQTRVAPKDNYVNIVGVAINPVHLDDPLRKKETATCIKLSGTTDISNGKNGYMNTLKVIKNLVNNDVGYQMMPYWIFNKNNDKIKMKTYENLSQMNSEEYFKFLISKIYDELISVTYERIINKINQNLDLTLFGTKEIINSIQNSLITIYNSNYYNDVLSYIYYRKFSLSNLPLYDKNENKIPGLNSKLIKIPTYKETEKKEATILIKKQEFLTGVAEEEIDELIESSLCQHQITWNLINIYKKKDPNKFNQALFEFIKKYVTENKDKEYICTSCYQYVDVKKYMHDSFTSSINNVALSVPLEANLENVPEYEKYSKAIKNMDKIVEKMAYISGVQLYLGNNPTNKYRRQDIIKYTIDLILLQNLNYDTSNINMRKERLESSYKLYGVNKDLSNYFIFDMDNNLFTYSSKDTDKYKRYKNNNILGYIVFLILCELNFGQIIQLNYDKLVNFTIFDKFAISLFDGLQIRINNGNDVRNLSNYKLLCYIIYYFSGMIIKFNYWYTDNQKLDSKGNMINPLLQKMIIHTVVDLINSILEINTRKNKNYIYEYIATKFFNKLNNIYSNNVSKDIIERLSSINDKKIEVVNNKIRIKSKDQSLILSLEKQHEISSFGYNVKQALPGKYFINSYTKDEKILDILGIKGLEQITMKQYKNTLEKIYKIFNEDGSKRGTILSNVSNLDIKILEKHANSVIKVEIHRNKESNKLIEIKLKAIEKEYLENVEYQENLKKSFNKDLFVVIDTVISEMENVIGKNININNANIYLNKTVYIINHDHLGNTRNEPIIFTDHENKLEFKKDEPYFKTDVYYFIDKARNITNYYDAFNLYFLGYKEMNKDYIQVKNSNKYLKINHSIKTKLSLLGHSKINYEVSPEIKDNKYKLFDFTSNVIRNRVHNLKNIIKEFQTIIYQIKNKYSGYGINPLVKQYIDKFKSLVYYNSEGDRIFENWKYVVDSIFMNNLKSNINIELTTKSLSDKSNVFYLNANKIIKFNNNDNLLIYYLCQQIQEFININKDQYNQTKLVYLISSIINSLFDQYNLAETIFMNNEVRKFNILLTNISYTDKDVDTLDITNLTEGGEDVDESKLTDEQKQKLEDENEDNKETDEGMDLDLDMDMDTADDSDEGTEMIQSEGRD